jgi:NAD(P)-dependent dehydrogenase (short-subunit alcohol dehydrogenase family)
VVDISALGAAFPAAPGTSGRRSGSVVVAVHEAARRFARRHSRDASLTVLLPADEAGVTGRGGTRVERCDWQNAGDGAAARMLVATLACELAPRALRVNAIEVGFGMHPERLGPLLRYIAGAGAQYLTGQTLQAAAS